MHKSAPLKGDSRRESLDGLRGFAILAIVTLHFFVYPLLRSGEGRFASAVGTLGRHLWTGVDLFFVLSGFLIASSVLHDRGQPRYFARFALRRSARILPLYALLLVVLVFLIATQRAPGRLLQGHFPLQAYATFTQNYWLARTGEYGGDLMAATWSLAIEVQFYLVVALLVRCLSKRGLLVACAFMIAMSVACRHVFPYPASYAYTFCRADGLFAGVAAAVLWSGPEQPQLSQWLRDHRASLWTASIAVYVATAWFAPRAGGPWNHLAFALVFTVWLGLAVAAPTHNSALHAPWLRWFGRTSYGIYLFHYGMLSAAFALASRGEPVIRNAADGLLVAAALAICLGLVAVLHHAVELPMMALGKRLASSMGRTHPATALPIQGA